MNRPFVVPSAQRVTSVRRLSLESLFLDSSRSKPKTQHELTNNLLTKLHRRKYTKDYVGLRRFPSRRRHPAPTEAPSGPEQTAATLPPAQGRITKQPEEPQRHSPSTPRFFGGRDNRTETQKTGVTAGQACWSTPTSPSNRSTE